MSPQRDLRHLTANAEPARPAGRPPTAAVASGKTPRAAGKTLEALEARWARVRARVPRRRARLSSRREAGGQDPGQDSLRILADARACPDRAEGAPRSGLGCPQLRRRIPAAVEDQLISVSPCRKISRQPVAPTKVVPLTVDQVERLVATTPARPDASSERHGDAAHRLPSLAVERRQDPSGPGHGLRSHRHRSDRAGLIADSRAAARGHIDDAHAAAVESCGNGLAEAGAVAVADFLRTRRRPQACELPA